MSVDAFDQAFRDWLHGVYLDEQARQKERNFTAFINGLGERGHRITYDYLDRYIFVDGKLTITMRVAQEEKPETLLHWAEERLS